MALQDALNAALADRYEIERDVGRGGMASVWLARDLRHDRPVAIKVLHSELASALGVDRFLREVRLTARLQHPGIIPVLDSGVVSSPEGISLPWFAMPYIAGESLRARLERDGQLPVEEALQITREVADALHAAHSEGIIHRDIKPENLILSGGHVRIADFGIARALIETGDERLTSTGLAIGTPTYMSPEQATATEVDARTDQYSLACVLYEMLAGEPPFTGPTPQSIVARRLAEPVRSVRTVRSAVPVGVEAALLRALERVPVDRFADTAAFAAALEADALARPSVRGLRWPVLTLAAAGVVALVVLAWFIAQRGSMDPITRDPAVVELYQRGLRGYDRRTPEGTAEAIRAFTAAVGGDSTYGVAWAALARTYVRAYIRQFVIPGVAQDSVLRLAVMAVERAVALDPGSAEVLMTQANVSRIVDPTDVTPSIRTARRAVELDSTLGPAWHLLALGLAESGQMDEAMTAWRRMAEVSPSYLEGLGFLSQAHYWRHRYDSAARWADSAVAMDPTFVMGWQMRGHAAIEGGDYARGLGAFEAARRLSTGVELVNSLARIARGQASDGRRSDAHAILRQADSLAAAWVPPSLHMVVYLAQAHVALDEHGPAVAWLRRYSPREDLHFQLHLRCDAPFDPLRQEADFRALLLSSPGGGC